MLYTENVARERQIENFQNVGGKGEYGRYIKRPKSRKGERPPTESEGPPTPNCRPAIYIRTFLDNDP